MTGKADPQGFWAWFASQAEELRALVKRDEDRGSAVHRLDAALAEHGFRVAYDLVASQETVDLTFTPEGDDEQIPVVDALVDAAPAQPHWVFHGRRQRKPLPVALDFVKAVHGIDLKDLRFQVRVQDGLHFLRFMHPDLAERPEDQQYIIAASLLDHALGEDRAQRYVGGVSFSAEYGGIDMALVISELIRVAAHDEGSLSGPQIPGR